MNWIEIFCFEADGSAKDYHNSEHLSIVDRYRNGYDAMVHETVMIAV